MIPAKDLLKVNHPEVVEVAVMNGRAGGKQRSIPHLSSRGSHGPQDRVADLTYACTALEAPETTQLLERQVAGPCGDSSEQFLS